MVTLTPTAYARHLAKARADGIQLKATTMPHVYHATSSQDGAIRYAVRVTGELAGAGK